MDSKILWIDTETTGLIPSKHGIISVAAIIDIDGQVIDKFELEMKPTGRVSDKRALKINGYTYGKIQNLKPWEAVFPEFIHRINIKYSSEKFILGGQNVSFDDKFIRSWADCCDAAAYWDYLVEGEIDTMKISKQFLELESHKLGNLCKHFGVPLENAHNAMADIEATRKLYYVMMEKLEERKQLCLE